ncbi:MAG: HNH endonuclease [Phycisphaerales bacterium]
MKPKPKRSESKKRRTEGRIAWYRRRRVPPPESEVWPEQYRGERWKPIYALLLAGKCALCAHSCPLPRSRQLEDKWLGVTPRLHCTHHPSHPGEIIEVLLTDTCRNFKPKWWRPPRAKGAKKAPRRPTAGRSDGKTERVPLANGLFATVDAADYPQLSKYRWYASYRGSTIYAVRHEGGKETYMHRAIMQPRRGQIVHHRDRDGLNNRRDNLLVCTAKQHQGCRGPLGEHRRFVGVYWSKNRWMAQIRYRGKTYYLGRFVDEVEAAKARDRKAYELCGELAYLNFPEDLPALRRSCHRKGMREQKGAKGKRS